MSERPERSDGRRRRRSRRGKRPAPDAEATPEAADASSGAPAERRADARRGDDRPREAAVLKNPRSLERLRTRVEAAAAEIERLRHENAALAARIGELEARPAADDDATLLVLDQDPEALHDKVTAFIEAIDHYLATETDGGSTQPD